MDDRVGAPSVSEKNLVKKRKEGNSNKQPDGDWWIRGERKFRAPGRRGKVLIQQSRTTIFHAGAARGKPASELPGIQLRKKEKEVACGQMEDRYQ